MTNRISRKIAMVIALCAIISCTTASKSKPEEAIYPLSWSKPASLGPDCSLINGVYTTLGKTSHADAEYPITLDGAVFGRSYAWGAASEVGIRYDSQLSKLFIEYLGPDVDRSHPSSFSTIVGKCSDGQILIDQSGSSYVDGSFTDRNRTIRLNISSDGSLTVFLASDSTSRSLGIVWREQSAYVWYLFPRSGSN